MESLPLSIVNELKDCWFVHVTSGRAKWGLRGLLRGLASSFCEEYGGSQFRFPVRKE